MKTAVIALAVGLLTGCTTTTGRKIEQHQTKLITPGESRPADVRAALGQPDTRAESSDGRSTWLYMHASANMRPENFIPIVGMFAGGVESHARIITVTFTNDVVENVTFSESSSGIDAWQSSNPTGKPRAERAGKR